MITKELRYPLMFRWSLVSATAIALFWTGWYLINGSVPTVTEVALTPSWSYQIPIHLSRWWDILIGPIWSIIIIWFLSSGRFPYLDNKDLFAGLFAGLSVALVAGLFAGLSVALVAGLFAGLGAALGAGLFAGLSVALGAGLAYGFVYGLKYLFGWLWPVMSKVKQK